MLKYIVKRIGMALATLLVIIFVLFVLVRIMPGNPFPSERMSATQIANKRAEMGPGRSHSASVCAVYEKRAAGRFRQGLLAL